MLPPPSMSFPKPARRHKTEAVTAVAEVVGAREVGVFVCSVPRESMVQRFAVRARTTVSGPSHFDSPTNKALALPELTRRIEEIRYILSRLSFRFVRFVLQSVCLLKIKSVPICIAVEMASHAKLFQVENS